MAAAQSDRGLAVLVLPRDSEADARIELGATIVRPARAVEGAFEDLRQTLERYFAGKREEFDFPLDPLGTPFQLKVWQALRRIPYGQVSSYSQVAHDIGHLKAQRAVGGAVGRNPLGIIVPCHRVLRSGGEIGGFGAGLALKRQLLAIEKIAYRENSRHYPSGENDKMGENLVARR